MVFRRVVITSIIVSVLFLFAAVTVSAEKTDHAITKEYQQIRIESDEEFTDIAEEEGWMGSGSEQDPYMIKGYELNSIVLKNIRHHFVIEDCTISVPRTRTAVSIKDCSNFEIVDNEIKGATTGIDIEGAGDYRISENNIDVYTTGISSLNTDQKVKFEAWIVKNNIYSNQTGIDLESVSTEEEITAYIEGNEFITKDGPFPDADPVIGVEDYDKAIIKNNTVENSRMCSIEVRGCRDGSIIKNNDLSGKDAGVHVLFTWSCRIVENSITADRSDSGVYVRDSTDIELRDNKISRCGVGIFLADDANNNKLIGNELKDNGFGIIISETSKDNLIKDNLFRDNHERAKEDEGEDNEWEGNDITLSSRLDMFAEDTGDLIGKYSFPLALIVVPMIFLLGLAGYKKMKGEELWPDE